MSQYKPYPKYKPSGVDWVGNIPDGWDMNRLKRFSKIITGNTPPMKDDDNYSNEGLMWVKPDDLKGFCLIDSTKKYLSEKGSKLARRVPAYSPMVCCIGSVGKFGYTESDASTNQQINSILFNQQIINSKFGLYVMAVSEKEFLRQSNINVVAILNSSNQGDVWYAIPALREQHQIANFLDKKTAQIDELIDKKEKMIELLKEKRSAIINQAVTKGLDPNAKMKPSGIEWIGDIPDGWEVKKIRYLGQFQNGISKGAEYFGSGYPFLSYGDVYNNKVLPKAIRGLARSSNEDRKRMSVRKGDVFFTRTSETIEEIGIASTCLQTITDSIFSGFLIRFRPSKTDLIAAFSKYYFRSSVVQKFFTKEMNIVTRASLAQELLKRLPVLMPNIEEQREIATFLDAKSSDIAELILKTRDAIEKLREYRTAIITAAVTGKIDVRETKF